MNKNSILFLILGFMNFISSSGSIEGIDNKIEELQEKSISDLLQIDFLTKEISEEIIRKINGDEWTEQNIHILFCLDLDLDEYQYILKDNIQLLIKKLKEQSVSNLLNAKCLSLKISEAIIKKINRDREWKEEDIHILLCLDPNLNEYEVILSEERNIQFLINKLKEQSILDLLNAKRLSQKISTKIIEKIKWSKDNIHILFCLDLDSDQYEDILSNDNIEFLIEKLQKETISDLLNVKCFISEAISKKIISKINISGWDKDNIHILLCLDLDSDQYENILSNDNIEFLIKRLQEQSILHLLNTASCISQEISKKIIDKIKWSKDNIHILLCLDFDSGQYEDILSNDNIEFLIKRLQEQSILHLLNTASCISQEISKKIIEKIKWSKDNIHILLCLDLDSDQYEDILSNDNIEFLIEKFQKESISDLLNAKYFISKVISKKIIDKIKESGWAEENIHILLCLHPDSGQYEDILSEERNIQFLINKLKEQSISDLLNEKRLSQKISTKIIDKIKESGWAEENIHILLCLHPDSGQYEDILSNENNIQSLIDKLKEQSIPNLLNAKCLSLKISEAIIEKINKDERWNEDNIRILLCLDPNAKGYKDILDQEENIQFLINKLKEQSISNLLNAKRLSQKISTKIIEKIKWSKDNIHILFCLDLDLEKYEEILNNENNIQYLIEKLQGESIPKLLNRAFLPQKISEAIIDKINREREWNEHNIHILLCLDPNLSEYEGILSEERNIQLLIDKLQGESILDLVKKNCFLPQKISEAIIDKINLIEDNINILSVFDLGSIKSLIKKLQTEDISNLLNIKCSIDKGIDFKLHSLLHIFLLMNSKNSSSWQIRKKINQLFLQIDIKEEGEELLKNVYYKFFSKMNDININYVGMDPFGKITMSIGGFGAGVSSLLGYLLSIKKIRQEIKPGTWMMGAISLLSILTPVVVNEINKNIDKKYFEKRKRNFNKIQELKDASLGLSLI